MDVVWLGTTNSGGVPVMGTGTVEGVVPARFSVVVASRRPSTKYDSGVVPVFVTVTGTVTGTPAASVVAAASGSPGAEAVAGVVSNVTVMGCEMAVPDTWL